MAFKEGVVLGTVSLNATGSGTTAIGATSNTGTISIGNTSSGAVAIDCGTAGLTVGTTANAHTTTLGSTNGASATTVQSGSGALNVTATNGALTINSGTGALGISTDASATTVSFATGGAVKTVTLGSTNSTSSTAIKSGSGNVAINNGLTIDSTGRNYNTVQPAFLAYIGSQDNNVTGAGTNYTVGTNTAYTEVFDQGSNFVTSGTFTAPITGRYMLSAQILIIGTTIATTANLRINTSNRTYFSQFARPAGSNNICTYLNVLADFDASDTATVSIQVSGEAADTDDLSGSAVDCFFSGFLAC